MFFCFVVPHVLVRFYYIENHLRTQWLKTTTVFFLIYDSVYHLGGSSGLGQLGWFQSCICDQLVYWQGLFMMVLAGKMGISLYMVSFSNKLDPMEVL